MPFDSILPRGPAPSIETAALLNIAASMIESRGWSRVAPARWFGVPVSRYSVWANRFCMVAAIDRAADDYGFTARSVAFAAEVLAPRLAPQFAGRRDPRNAIAAWNDGPCPNAETAVRAMRQAAFAVLLPRGAEVETPVA